MLLILGSGLLRAQSVHAEQPTDSDEQVQIVQLDHLSFEKHPCIEVTRANTNPTLWRNFLRQLKTSPATQRGRYTVFHVKQEYPTKRAPITASGTTTRSYSPGKPISGNGAMVKVDSGDLIIWDHLNSSAPAKHPFRIGHAASGVMDFFTSEPPQPGKPRCYDLYMKVCPKEMRGKLVVTLLKRSNVKCSSFTINMVANGGIYGIDYRWPYNNNRPIELAPGPYSFLFRQIDPVKGRFDFKINPGVITQLNFKASSQNAVELVSQTFEPIEEKAK